MRKLLPNLVRLVPFFILLGVLLNTIIYKCSNNYLVQDKYWVSGILIVCNAILYFYRFKIGVWVTSILIILSIFNVLNFFDQVYKSDVYIQNPIFGKISTPVVDERLLLVFLLTIILNFKIHKEVIRWVVKRI